MRRLLPLLLILTVAPALRAQLTLRPPALQFIHDQAPELAVGGGFDPGMDMLNRHRARWFPNRTVVDWTGRYDWATAAGNFNSWGHSAFNALGGSGPVRVKTSVAVGVETQALRSHIKGPYRWPGMNVSLFNSSLDTEGRWAGRTGQINIYESVDAGHYHGHYSVGGLLNRNEDPWGLTVKDRVATIYTSHQINRVVRGSYAPDLLLEFGGRHAKTRGQYLDREGLARRDNVNLSLQARKYGSDLSYTAEARFDHWQDSLRLGDYAADRRENRGTFTAWAHYQFHPFSVEVIQRYLTNRLDPDRYLPGIRLHVFPTRELTLTAGAGRAGEYRNPFLTETYLLRSERRFAVPTEPRTEDFWRYVGEVNYQTGTYKVLSATAQFIHREYDNYVATRYAPGGELRLEQLGGTRRTTLAAEVSYEPGDWLLKANYRYDYTRVPGRAGTVLLPARHAVLLEARYAVEIYLFERESRLSWATLYLHTSRPAGLDTETVNPENRRLDFTVKLDYRHFQISLYAEQLLRDDGALLFGEDPFGGVGLGGEMSGMTGRWVGVSFGGSF